MRCRNDVGASDHARGRCRFALQDIERSAAQLAPVERLDQRLVIHQATAADVDEQRLVATASKELSVDEMTGRRGERQVQNDGVRFFLHLRNRGHDDSWTQLAAGAWIAQQAWTVYQHAAAEAARQFARTGTADSSVADDRDGHVTYAARLSGCGIPFSPLASAVQDNYVTPMREQEGNRVIGDLLHAVVGNVHDPRAAGGRSLDRNVVQSYAHACHNTQGRGQ